MMHFAWRLFRRHWYAGELRVLAFSLLVAVTAVTAVGFFTDRVQQVLVRQGNLLLGADLLLVADHVLPQATMQKALDLKLDTATTINFPSMVTHGELSHLSRIKAVSEGYPLRGHLRIAESQLAPEQEVRAVPKTGTVWLEPRLMAQLQVAVGDEVSVGAIQLKVAAVLRHEPDRGGSLFNIAPRLMMNQSDVAATGLIQYGSRVSYRLLLAGDDKTVDQFKTWALPQLKAGERLEDVSEARPEIRNVLNKARQFLGLSAMVSVILAAVAMVLAGLRFITRHWDTCAIMRCFGASQRFIVRVFLLQLLLIGLMGSLAGCVMGYLAQEILSQILTGLLLESLPRPSMLPVLQGMLMGLALLSSIIWPLLLQLRNVPTLRVLRKEIPVPALNHMLTIVPAAVILTLLVLWTTKDIALGSMAMAGMSVFFLIAAMLAWFAVKLLRRAGRSQVGSWRFGVANLARHPLTSIMTIAAFSVGLMALLLLTIVRGDLLRNWQATLPVDAPNRFVINIQPDQLPQLRQFLSNEGISVPSIHPMVRGRLIAINNQPLDTTRYDERGRRLAEREFNLSWAQQMQADNSIVSGRWWDAQTSGQAELSIEQGIAETLGMKLGDRLTYDIGGETIEFEITSLRKVEWDSMRANFFAIVPPGTLDSFSASYITSFFLPQQQETVLNQLVRQFPNMSVIDIAAIMQQVRSIIDRMAHAVQFVFGFSLLSGALVLYAALAATHDSRASEYTLLRALGASRRQIKFSILTEFGLIATLAGVVAALGASVIAWVISRELLQLPYQFNPALLIWGVGLAVIIIPFAAWWALRKTTYLPPRQILNSI